MTVFDQQSDRDPSDSGASSRDPMGVLRDRLGVRYRSSIDDGRTEIARVLSDELNISRDEAHDMVRRLVDSGQLRYVTDVEHDVDYNVEARGEPTSRDNGLGNDVTLDGSGPSNRGDTLRTNAIPGGGGPQEASLGLSAGAAAPLAVGTSSGGGGAVNPVVAGADPGRLSDDRNDSGYWDFDSERSTVVPSTSRKGQVEPSGT